MYFNVVITFVQGLLHAGTFICMFLSAIMLCITAMFVALLVLILKRFNVNIVIAIYIFPIANSSVITTMLLSALCITREVVVTVHATY